MSATTCNCPDDSPLQWRWREGPGDRAGWFIAFRPPYTGTRRVFCWECNCRLERGRDGDGNWQPVVTPMAPVAALDAACKAVSAYRRLVSVRPRWQDIKLDALLEAGYSQEDAERVAAL